MINQTSQKMADMRLSAMANEYNRQMETPAMTSLDFDTRLAMLVDAEWTERNNGKVKRLLKAANLKITSASFADIDYRQSRHINRGYIARLSNFDWVKESRNIFITGCTGTGKTWLSCAFGVEACRQQMHVLYYRTSRLLSELRVANGDGSLMRLLSKIKKANILILDDWGIERIKPAEGQMLLEVLEDRYGVASTIIAAQIPVTQWHELFDDSTVADAVMDRLIYNAHRFELEGPSMRRKQVNDGDIGQTVNEKSEQKSEANETGGSAVSDH
jgi:DNA replication protein DnaC